MRLCLALSAAALLVPCLALHADTLDYTFTGVNVELCGVYGIDCQPQTIEFQVPSDPTVTSFTSNTFTTSDFSLVQSSGPFYLPTDDPYTNGVLTFGTYGISNYNGIQIGSPTRIGSGLLPLFTGPTSSPTLLTGSSSSASAGYYSVQLGGSLNITDISTPPTPTPVPEPSSLALLGTGLLGMVAAARRRLS